MSEVAEEEPVEKLQAAEAELRSVEAAIEDVGPTSLRRLVDAHDRFDDLLTRYRERASGSGRETFEAYVEFQGRLGEFVSELPDDLLHREAFEDAADLLDRRRLEERDFDRAREALSPASQVADLIGEREAAERRYREARHAVEARRNELQDRIDDLESLLAFEDADLDAPVEALREPIEAYESAVDDAFRAFRSDASAREVLDLVESTSSYPLVDFPDPPAELRHHLRENPAGEEPIPTLLEWAGYTASKLSHYVEDPPRFRAAVGGNRTYLSRLDAGPLHVGWPPPPAGTLRFRARELVAVVERFAPESTVSRLHAVRRLTGRDDYETLRRSAVARRELTDEDRRRLRDGSVHDEIESLRAECDRLAEALAEHDAR